MPPTPRCFTSLCVLSHCSHLCLPSPPTSPSPPRVASAPSLAPSLPGPRLHFSTSFLHTLVATGPHLTPYPHCFTFLVLVLQLDCVCVHARTSERARGCVCVHAPTLPVDNRTARVGKIGEWRRGGRSARVPFSIRTKHACGAGRHQLEMQSGPLS